jgi:hypothetical protein
VPATLGELDPGEWVAQASLFAVSPLRAGMAQVAPRAQRRARARFDLFVAAPAPLVLALVVAALEAGRFERTEMARWSRQTR